MAVLVECYACGRTIPEADVARSHWEVVELDDGGQADLELSFCASCVRQEDRELLLDAARDAFRVLDEELRGSRMFRNVWRRANEALGWIYMLDEFHRSQRGTRVDYSRRRENSAGGCALAGLVWARGKAVHTMWQFEAWSHGQSQSAGWGRVDVVREGTTVWAPRHTTKDEPGADHYAKHVAGRPLLEPMREALLFLAALDETY